MTGQGTLAHSFTIQLHLADKDPEGLRGRGIIEQSLFTIKIQRLEQSVEENHEPNDSRKDVVEEGHPSERIGTQPDSEDCF